MVNEVLVNGRFLARRVTGVERYGREILSRLESRARVIQPRRQLRGMRGHAWEQFVLPSKVSSINILWSPANTGPLAVRNQVLTLHDLSPLEHSEWYTDTFGRWYRFFMPRLAKRVRHVVTPSEYIRQKVIKRFSLPAGKVTVVPGGVDRDRFHHGLAPLTNLPDRYILSVGSIQPRKHHSILLQAWIAIQSNYPDVWLLIAGTTDPVFRQGSFPGGIDRLRWLGYVPDADLPGLYAGAEVFVFPSEEEGFGLPLLEAMACGTPAVAARAGALPEVAGDAVLWFDPADTDAFAENLARCLDEAELRQDLSRKGLARANAFPWERSAGLLWEVLQKC